VMMGERVGCGDQGRDGEYRSWEHAVCGGGGIWVVPDCDEGRFLRRVPAE